MTRPVGIDIGSHSIKLIELQEKKAQLELVRVASKQITADDLKSGLRELIGADKSSVKHANLSLSGPPVIVRYIDMPAMKKGELKSAMKFEAEKYVPFDIKDAIVDCAVLDKSPAGNTNRVLLVAAKKERVNYYMDLFKEFGIEINAIDVDAAALLNAFQSTGLEKKQDATYAVLNIGARFSNVNVVTKTYPYFTRDILWGGADVTNRIKDSMGLGLDEAEALKRNPGGKKDNVGNAIVPTLEKFVSEIKMSFDYFESQFGRGIERLYISGGSSYLFNIRDYLKEGFGIDVIMWNPFEGINMPDATTAKTVEDTASQFAVAVGLALRK